MCWSHWLNDGRLSTLRDELKTFREVITLMLLDLNLAELEVREFHCKLSCQVNMLSMLWNFIIWKLSFNASQSKIILFQPYFEVLKLQEMLICHLIKLLLRDTLKVCTFIETWVVSITSEIKLFILEQFNSFQSSLLCELGIHLLDFILDLFDLRSEFLLKLLSFFIQVFLALVKDCSNAILPEHESFFQLALHFLAKSSFLSTRLVADFWACLSEVLFCVLEILEYFCFELL